MLSDLGFNNNNMDSLQLLLFIFARYSITTIFA